MTSGFFESFGSSRICWRARCCISSAARFVYVTTTSCGSHSSASELLAVSTTRLVIARVLPEPAEATTEKFRFSSHAKHWRALTSTRLLTNHPPVRELAQDE